MATIPSLALIPSGYKASKVYSVLPTDGTGDFTFTRSGNATRINSEGLIELVSTNVPRLNYPLIDGVVQGCPSLLLEPKRTNSFTYSEQFDNAAWTKLNATISANAATSPDGYANADLLVGNGVSGSHYVLQSASVTSGAAYTASIFAKAGTNNFLQIFLGNAPFSSTTYANFDLSDGTIGTIGATASNVFITPYGNGWYRIGITGTAAASGAAGFVAVLITSKTAAFLESNTLTTNVEIYGAQYEAGSYPTSYIPTSGTTATRSAETCNNAGDVNTFNDSEGVLFAEISALANDLTDRSLSLSSGYYNNRIEIRYNDSSNGIRVFGIVGGAFQFDSSSSLSLPNITNQSKLAFKYKENNFALWVNGFEIYSDLFGSIFSEGVLNEIKFSDAQGAEPFYGNTKQIQYFNTALNDSDLETLTSWDSFSDMAIGQLYTIE